MSVATKLAKLKAIKQDIKSALEEKGQTPSNVFSTYANNIRSIETGGITPSGEIEITAVNNAYLEKGSLSVELLGRGMAWLDTGTYDGLLEASNFIATIQKRQGLYVSCIEEIAWRNGWLSKEKLLELAKGYKTDYGRYLEYIAEN